MLVTPYQASPKYLHQFLWSSHCTYLKFVRHNHGHETVEHSRLGTRTLCFLKFLLCYALIPNTKPIMLIIMCLFCSQLLVLCRLNTWQFVWKFTFMLTLLRPFTFLCSEQTSYYTTLVYNCSLNIRKALFIWSTTYSLTLLCQHYASIIKPPIMPKAIPAYCACPYSRLVSVVSAYTSWLYVLKFNTFNIPCQYIP